LEEPEALVVKTFYMDEIAFASHCERQFTTDDLARITFPNREPLLTDIAKQPFLETLLPQ